MQYIEKAFYEGYRQHTLGGPCQTDWYDQGTEQGLKEFNLFQQGWLTARSDQRSIQVNVEDDEGREY